MLHSTSINILHSIYIFVCYDPSCLSVTNSDAVFFLMKSIRAEVFVSRCWHVSVEGNSRQDLALDYSRCLYIYILDSFVVCCTIVHISEKMQVL